MFAVLTLALLAQPQEPPKKEEPKPRDLRAEVIKKYGLEPDKNDTVLRKLQKERCIERAMAIAKFKEVIEIGNWRAWESDDYIKLLTTFPENLAELSDKATDKVKCYEMRVEMLKDAEKFFKKRSDTGADPTYTLKTVIAARIDAELALLKLKESLKTEK
jgi:hypothetical protein